jgi:hypothetical protein
MLKGLQLLHIRYQRAEIGVPEPMRSSSKLVGKTSSMTWSCGKADGGMDVQVPEYCFT